MSEDPKRDRPAEAFRERVDSEETRKLKARGRDAKVVAYGLGTLGMIGWSVAMPTVLGALLGAWLDKTYPSAHSWTLALLVAGLVGGCFIAWHWVSKEADEIHKGEL